LSPIIHVSGSAPFAELDIDASLKRIKVKADIKHILSVTVLFPSSTGIDPELLKRLIENLLRPSIDLENLLKGNIVISPDRGHSSDGSDEQAGAEPGEQAEAEQGKGEQHYSHVSPGDRTGVVNAATSKPGRESGTVRLAFSTPGEEIRISDDGRLLLGSFPYEVRRLEKNGNVDEGGYEVSVHQSTVKALLSKGSDGLLLIPGSSAFALDDGWYLPMCRGQSCAPENLVAVKVSLGDGGAEDNVRSVPFLSIPKLSDCSVATPHALSRVMQLALVGGVSGGNPELACDDFGSPAIYRLHNDPDWSFFSNTEIKIESGSLWHELLEKLDVPNAIKVISATSNSVVQALTPVNTVGVERALIQDGLPFARSALSFFGVPIGVDVSFIRVGKLTPYEQMLHDLSKSGGLASIESSSRTFKSAQFSETSAVIVEKTWKPWQTVPHDTPLSKVLEALPTDVQAGAVGVSFDSSGLRALAYPTPPTGTGSWIFSMRRGNQTCPAVKRTGKELADLLAVWAKDPSLDNPKSGRLKRDPQSSLAALTTELVDWSHDSPFLTDPIFLFYPKGICP
jgi:hypothetical protein